MMVSDALRRRMNWVPASSDQRSTSDEDKARSPRLRQSYPAWLGQAFRYSAVGMSNTALDAVLYLVLTHWLGLGGLKILAKTISYGVGTLNSFHWNRSWTFKSKARAAATFIPFVLTNLLALGINAAAMYLSLRLFSQNDFPALALATGLTLLWNFGVAKFLIFKR